MQPPRAALGVFAEIKEIELREAGLSGHRIALGIALGIAPVAGRIWLPADGLANLPSHDLHPHPAQLSAVRRPRAAFFLHSRADAAADLRLCFQLRLAP